MSGTTTPPHDYKSVHLLEVEELIKQRTFEYGGLVPQPRRAVSQQLPLPDHMPELGPEAMKVHLEGWHAAQQAQTDPYIPAPTIAQNIAAVEALQTVLDTRSEPKPEDMAEPALRDALREAVALHDNKRLQLNRAEAVETRGREQIAEADSELKTFADLDQRIQAAIVSELRDGSGRAEVPYALQAAQRERARLVDFVTSLGKAQAQISAEVGRMRADVVSAAQAMRTAANAVLACRAQAIAVEVDKADETALAGRQQLAALALLADATGPISLPSFVVSVLRREIQKPKVETADRNLTEHWRELQTLLCTDADAQVAS
jgi:hypothetical protein